MTTRQRARRLGRRSRSRTLAGGLSLALLAGVATLIPGALPAAADTITTSATLALACTADSPIGAQAVNQDLTIAIDHPDKIARNTVETVVISQPAMSVPTEVAGYPLVSLSNINVSIKVPSQFRIESATTVNQPLLPGNLQAAASVSYSATGDATLTIPGPLNGGSTYQIPELHIGLRAVGTPGTSGGFLFKSFNVTARASLPVFGASNLPTTCPTPSPNPPMFSIGVAPGAFSTAPDPVTNVANLDQPTVVKYSSTQVPSGSTRTSNPFSIAMTAVPDVDPGQETTVNIGVGGTDWLAPYRVSPHQTYTAGLIAGGRDVTGIREWKMTLGGPSTAAFQVVDVTSANPAVMTATYNSTTNEIVLARPAGAAGELGIGTSFLPPAVSVKVKAVGTGPYRQTGSFTFKSVSFSVGYRTVVCLIVCSNPSSSFIAATTTGPAPGGSGTQPNNSVYFPNVIGGTVLGTVGIAVRPGANNDTATVANNVPGVDIDVLANDVAGTDPFNPATVTIVDDPQAGTVQVDPTTGVVTYSPTYGTLEKTDGFTYAVKDTAGRWSNVASVNIGIVGIYCVGPCALDQIIEVDVLPDALSMSQAGGTAVLGTVTLDGSAQTATGPLQPVTVTNRRGGTAAWSLTGQLTSDFRGSDADPACPAGTPGSWNYRCIPGDNLGWEPLADVGHEVVPGDVASVASGPASTAGLRSTAQSLCTAPPTESGGTFTCGALLSLGVPASAGAQGYSAVITLTLA